WVDGQPRVSCVTPVARVNSRAVTTIEALPDADEWARRFCDAGASQCGVCTPGIIMRLAAMEPAERTDVGARQAMLAHLCRCTGWETIIAAAVGSPAAVSRDLVAAARRAAIEGGPQRVGPDVALGRGGFAADSSPLDSLIAVLDEAGEWVVAETMHEARRVARKVSGRRTTAPLRWPIDPPPGEWERTLRTTWVEPGFVELDAAWCVPGGEPVGPDGNGGAFGGKAHSEVAAAARRLADLHGRTVLATFAREDVVRRGPKRPPIAAGIHVDGSGVVRVARTAGIAGAITAFAPNITVEEVDLPAPPTSANIRAAGWAEVAVLLSSLREVDRVVAPSGAIAEARLDAEGAVHVRVECGAPLDEVVLRSYCIGAAHMALGWVRSEALAVDGDGVPMDLTVRSFGILRAVDTPAIHVEIVDSDAPPVNGSDAVFAAVAAAAWRHAGFPGAWPTMRS
ncbi:unnamed protein product, partial [Phaeothamnion confervicola]